MKETSPRLHGKQRVRLERPSGLMTLSLVLSAPRLAHVGPALGSVSWAFILCEHGTPGTQGVKPALELGAGAHGVLPDNKANESLLAGFSCTITFNHHLHSR